MHGLRLHLVLTAFFLALPLSSAEFDHSHKRYAKILSVYVKDSRVDYAGLKKNPKELDAYLLEIASVPPAEFDQWTKEQRLALLMNLYNAHTFKRIIDHHPLESIRDIGILPGAAWRIQDVRFGGQLITLDHLENKIIRAEYDEPRIHFALVCAALSCPPLRGEPYVADKLDAQLNDQTKRFMAESGKNRFDGDGNTLWLSPIFKWYDEDFGELKHYAARYLPAPAGGELRQAEDVRIRYTEYDWSLNEWTK